nr:precorrin-3B synthase [Methylobacterium haplocladii]
MPTGDGLLARVHPPLGVLSAAQLRAVAEASRRYGNGHVDITARGNLQIRGVSEGTAPPLAAWLADFGLADVRSDGGPQRLTLASALAGFDADEAIDVLALARAIEDVGLTVPGLPAKTLVAIDGGGRWGLGAAEADVFLSATGAARVAIGLASETGTDWCAEIAIDDAPAAVGRVLNAFVATGRRRVRDLGDSERVQLLTAHAEPSRASPSPLCGRGWTLRQQGSGEGSDGAEACGADLSPALSDGTLPRRGGRFFAGAPEPGLIALSSGLTAIIVEAPFGRCTADNLNAVAALQAGEASSSDVETHPRHSGAAQRNPEPTTGHCVSGGFRVLARSEPRNDGGESEDHHAGLGAAPASQDAIRLTPNRGLVLFVREDQAEPTRAALAAAGIITESADPRRAVAACPGAPACASGTTPVPRHAGELATAFAPFAARGLFAHVSGCAKGCAHPRKAGLTLVAEGGRYRVVLDGAPGDGGHAPSLTFEAALDRVRRADPAQSLAGAFGP